MATVAIEATAVAAIAAKVTIAGEVATAEKAAIRILVI